MKDANYPWFILVPDRDNISEVFQLSDEDQRQLAIESSRLSEAINKSFKADKINIAALGNIVPQLHIHHIVRYTTDACWPSPVWGAIPAAAYTEDGIENVITTMQQAGLTDLVFFNAEQ